ncbi:PilT protein domain protein [Planctopirus limnophila DSM 3776]|uniref:Ribonuclease VapC n=1 Tax=Planctopirus limnophila (strain ATCC 43296 / DSM 3776 / IFAM 1008 / Mu 290) TaxID=521674 RepID=D5SS85_PLAL2|nr:type II toxin-antitoxin system VapC family toxin [Planctopirus limnophila]ADG68809.1 PilT protein domain protein [Planctopirus limnophila DSM 3776]
MHPRTLLDTDVLSGLMKRNQTALNRARKYLSIHQSFTISLMTRFELMRGLQVKQASAQLAAFAVFCNNNVVLPLNDNVIVRAAEIYADLYRRGALIPDADILIAATAIENDLVLATNNVDDFARIADLQIDNWLTSS